MDVVHDGQIGAVFVCPKCGVSVTIPVKLPLAHAELEFRATDASRPAQMSERFRATACSCAQFMHANCHETSTATDAHTLSPFREALESLNDLFLQLPDLPFAQHANVSLARDLPHALASGQRPLLTLRAVPMVEWRVCNCDDGVRRAGRFVQVMTGAVEPIVWSAGGSAAPLLFIWF
jgi:hypothetical protein